ncbi:DUF2207 family protein [Miniphocaeibacter halophilus]|uniref:DUF2207 domain-containing protein n=1 Tax=Miniphocaeibacter halophilus TaxID=2931922 RepID=A0AC61MPX2_9FIRM|nr:DUF2207 domain-containing protein [Miniphocaeibacter halophilus]QQK07303.1 DUF2207 domain-containing protein [Miniphocaeibacter halophilus]
MKKIKLIILSIILLLFPTISFATELESVNINVKLEQEGDAILTNEYNYYDDEGTEHYIVMGNLSDSEIMDYVVYYNNKPMEFVDNWNTSWSFEEKSGKYGFVETNNGYELCYGISEYGNNNFVVQYKLTNFVKNSDDYQFFNWKFINDKLSEDIDRVKVEIEVENYDLSYENSKIWAFGYDGEINFENGKIVAENNRQFKDTNYLTILTQFTEPIFSTSSSVNKSFEEIQKEAFEGSSYTIDESGKGGKSKSDESKPSTHIAASSVFKFLGPIILLITGLLLSWQSKRVKKDNYKGTESNYIKVDRKSNKGLYYREIPYSGNLGDLLIMLNGKWPKYLENYISAYFLKWIQEKKIETVKDKSGIVFKKEKISFKILEDNINTTDAFENYLYNAVLSAAKGKGILEAKDFKSWASKNHVDLTSSVADFTDLSKNLFEDLGYVNLETKVNRFSKHTKILLTSKGQELMDNLVRFENYLKDYSLLNTRDSYNVHIWDNYMIYAALLGITKEVEKEFEKLYPDYYNETYYDLETIFWIRIFSSGFYSSYSSAASPSSGAGGFSSLGGGGGSFGGGSGGGTR